MLCHIDSTLFGTRIEKANVIQKYKKIENTYTVPAAFPRMKNL